MTRRRRTQVVELLRCAADERVDGIGLNGMFDAADQLDADSDVHSEAWDVLDTIRIQNAVVVGAVDERYRHALLEAAARVELKEYP